MKISLSQSQMLTADHKTAQLISILLKALEGTDEGFYEEVIELSQRFKTIEEKAGKNLVSPEEAGLEKAGIHSQLLDILGQLDNEEQLSMDIAITPPTREEPKNMVYIGKKTLKERLSGNFLPFLFGVKLLTLLLLICFLISGHFTPMQAVVTFAISLPLLALQAAFMWQMKKTPHLSNGASAYGLSWIIPMVYLVYGIGILAAKINEAFADEPEENFRMMMISLILAESIFGVYLGDLLSRRLK